MDWQGIEWALPIFELVMIALPVPVFITLYRRTKCGVLKKSRAMMRYASLVIAPVIVYGAFFIVLTGFEELTHISMVTEGLARSFILLIGSGVMIWIVSTLAFGVALAFIKERPLLSSPDARTKRTT